MGDEHAGVVPEERALAVENIGGELEGDRELGELLHELPDGDGRVVGSAATAEDDSPGPADGADKVDHTAQEDALGSLALVARHHAAPHGLDHGLGLLVNLLLHEVLERPLHDLLHLHLERLHGALNLRALHGGLVRHGRLDPGDAVRAFHPVDPIAAVVQVRDVVIL